MGSHARIGLLNREEIEDEIERLIGLLDTEDAATEDMEPELDGCLAGDDGCGYVELGALSGWGSAEEDTKRLPVPVYDVDQTEPPSNLASVRAEYRARELGLERSPTGGWRYER